jgi:hypothetical protein
MNQPKSEAEIRATIMRAIEAGYQELVKEDRKEMAKRTLEKMRKDLEGKIAPAKDMTAGKLRFLGLDLPASIPDDAVVEPDLIECLYKSLRLSEDGENIEADMVFTLKKPAEYIEFKFKRSGPPI